METEKVALCIEPNSKNFKNSKIVAFGSTRRAKTEVSQDEGIKDLINAGTDIVTVFGKSWDFHVTDILNTELYENLNMIYDTVCYLKDSGKEVFYDAEHFFDGYKHNKEYALKTLEAAYFGGASRIILCDTNGSAFPDEIEKQIEDCLTVNCFMGFLAEDDKLGKRTVSEHYLYQQRYIQFLPNHLNFQC